MGLIDRLKAVFRVKEPTTPDEIRAPRLEVIVWKDGERVFHKPGIFSVSFSEEGIEIYYPSPTDESKTLEADEYDQVDILIA